MIVEVTPSGDVAMPYFYTLDMVFFHFFIQISYYLFFNNILLPSINVSYLRFFTVSDDPGYAIVGSATFSYTGCPGSVLQGKRNRYVGVPFWVSCIFTHSRLHVQGTRSVCILLLFILSHYL